MTLALSHGSHRGKKGGCLVEVASLLLGRKIVRDGEVQPDWEWQDKTDNPECINTVVCCAAQFVNDRTPEHELPKLAHLLPALLRARSFGSLIDDREWRITKRLVVWAAHDMLGRITEAELRERLAHELDAFERATGERPNQPCWVPGWNSAARAVANTVNGNPVVAINNAVRTLGNDELGVWLADLLDMHEKILADEGLLGFDPDIEYPPDDEVNAVIAELLGN